MNMSEDMYCYKENINENSFLTHVFTTLRMISYVHLWKIGKNVQPLKMGTRILINNFLRVKLKCIDEVYDNFD